jgi:hypothetical protein
MKDIREKGEGDISEMPPFSGLKTAAKKRMSARTAVLFSGPGF